MKWKIIADSGCDLREIENLAPDTQYINVPLTVQVGDKHYTDDASLDIDAMMIEMYQTKDQTASACPSPDAFLEAYKGAENVIAITITGGLSGSQNSAQFAKKMLLEEAPETNIEVFDSLSASGEMVLFVQKANELIAQGLSFEEVVAALKEYLGIRDIIASAGVANLFVNLNGNQLTRQGVWRIVKEYSHKAGINKDVNLNTFRHSFAVHLLQNGANVRAVQKLLGNQVLTYMDTYYEIINNDKINLVYKNSHPRA